MASFGGVAQMPSWAHFTSTFVSSDKATYDREADVV